MALATLNTDAGPTLNWLPGAVILPLPDNGQQIQRVSNVQQLGRGAEKSCWTVSPEVPTPPAS